MQFPMDAPWHTNTTVDAAQADMIDCMIFAHENGCPWHRYTLQSAVTNGSNRCFVYAHENGAPWVRFTVSWAADYENEYALKHIYKNCGDICPWIGSGLEDFEEQDFSSEIKDYLRSVQDSWKRGDNTPSTPKPVKRSQSIQQ